MGPRGWSRVGVARGLRGVLALSVVLAGWLVGAPIAGATFAKRDGEILSFNDDPPPGLSGIWLSGPRGQHPEPVMVPVAVPNAGVFDPVATFSPSGRRLAFLQESDTESPPPFFYGVEVTDAQGGAARLLFQGQLPKSVLDMSGLAFSPNGRTLAVGYVFASGPYSLETKLVFVNVSTGKVTRSVVLAGDREGLEWSATGELFFRSGFGQLLYAVRPDGSHIHKVKIGFPNDDEEGWQINADSPSPNGSELVVDADYDNCSSDGISVRGPIASAAKCSGEGVFLVPAAGGRLKRLGPGIRDDAIWSPDGRQVISAVPKTGDVGLLTLATGRVTKLNIPGYEVLAWQALPR